MSIPIETVLLAERAALKQPTRWEKPWAETLISIGVQLVYRGPGSVSRPFFLQ